MRDEPMPRRWDIETDVLVVGGGNAGLPAAISARERGADVLIVEENTFLGGLMRGSGGFMFFCDTHVQARVGIEDDVEWGIEDELLMSEYRAVPEIVRAYVEGGAETVRWLERLGLAFSDRLLDGDPDPLHPERRRVARTHYAAVSPSGLYPGGFPEGQNGYALTCMFEKAVERLGIPVRYEHRMIAIHRDPSGPVVGITARTPEGRVTIRARKAVVLAAGGATTNEQLVRSWDPRMVNDAIYSDGLPYMRAMGDALLAAQEIGAGLSDMSFVSFTPVRFGTHYYSLSLEAIGGAEGISRVTGLPVGPRRQGFQRIVLVKGDGTRYVNEAEATHRNPRLIRDTNGVPPAEYPEEPFIAKFLALGNPKNVWAVTDAVSAGEMRWPVDQIVSPNPRRGRGLHPDSVAHADNLEELAEKIGMPIERFMETMTRYNEFAKAGIDADLGKPAPLFEIVEAPFYAAKMNIIRHTPPGGLRINSKGQVLDRAQLFDGMTSVGVDEEQVIPGLYAAGECAAFVGFRRSHRKTGPIITMGRIAGISAAGSS